MKVFQLDWKCFETGREYTKPEIKFSVVNGYKIIGGSSPLRKILQSDVRSRFPLLQLAIFGKVALVDLGEQVVGLNSHISVSILKDGDNFAVLGIKKDIKDQVAGGAALGLLNFLQGLQYLLATLLGIIEKSVESLSVVLVEGLPEEAKVGVQQISHQLRTIATVRSPRPSRAGSGLGQ